jgi:quaternary ammonium compound-resistance protein SugE
MPWVFLFVAGLFEIVWAVGLKYSHGFTRPLASAVTVAAFVASLALLGVATKTLPIGTAYAVWMGVARAARLAGRPGAIDRRTQADRAGTLNDAKSRGRSARRGSLPRAAAFRA